MCVFGIHVLKIAIERCFWEVYYGIWIIGWVACWIAFMSVFFTSQKITFKSWLDTSLIPCYLSSFLSFFLSQSRQLLDTWWIDRESSCLLGSFSTAGGSIEFLFLNLMVCSSTPPWYLYLLKTNFLTPSSTDVSTPLDTFICRDLLRVYLNFLVRSDPHFFRSLSR